MTNFILKSVGNALNLVSFISPKYASKKAINLYETPRKGGYSEDQKKVVSSAYFQEFVYDEITIATYRWVGKNKTVLLAHGWESNASRWDYILKDFIAQNYNIIALDAPAHGRSGGKQFNSVLYSKFINRLAQKFKPDVLIGHSVGGMANVFAMHNFELPTVKKIILLGAPAHFNGAFLRYKKMMGYNTRISKGIEAIVLKEFNKPVDYFSAASFCESIEAKGLIVHDKKDEIIPYEDAQLFAKSLKSSELISTNGFGHGLKDASLTHQIIEFINE
jgi:pimeloyl-ACP methyl ester carboxylesterase